jgi:hypothetical protein
LPSITIGPSLVVPTGISPYDNVTDSLDVTGRGFYRLDGNVLISKTLHPWSTSLALSYGTYFERVVNREYGTYHDPYHKKLGDRTSAAVSVNYIYYLGSGGDTLTGTVSLSKLQEENTSYDGVEAPLSGMRKDAVAGTIAYSSTDRDWGVRASWSHALQQNGKGENFPTTDIYTIGVNYGFR